jgi:TPP-dependent pyruvate/acetoin dehydrogenase alpha subunit
MIKEKINTTLTFEDFKTEVLNDYKIAITSRECSLLGRREVLTGKAKFGIFGDGKEVPQLAMAKFFKNGDFRSGYYRDQTFMMAIGQLTVQQFFAGLYGNTNILVPTFLQPLDKCRDYLDSPKLQRYTERFLE